jgi:sulfoxide reductase catalytic subunit YedY
MIYRPSAKIPSSQITPRETYLNRRTLMAGAAGAAAMSLLPGAALAALETKPSPYSTSEEPTGLKSVTSYNNFYEFGVSKDDPAAYADALTTTPWSIKVDGLVAKPAT